MTYLKNYYICDNILHVILSNDGNIPKDELYKYTTRYESMYERVLIYDPEDTCNKFNFIFDKLVGYTKEVNLWQKISL